MNLCKICMAELNGIPLKAREEMYGMGGEFTYGQCPKCGCLQLLEIPEDLQRFYPTDYYSYSPPTLQKDWKFLRRGFKRKLILEHWGVLTPLLKIWLSSYPIFWAYRRLGMRTWHKVLDVGSGNGTHVLEIRSAGVIRAMGVDPFVEKDIWLDEQLLVKKAVLEEMQESFDFIVFHHSLEHMPEQIETLRKARALLADGGKILVRIPTVSSQAFLEYKEKWCQLDAPRHLFLHSHTSFHRIAAAAGLTILDRWCDSSEIQFIASEQYQKSISLFDPKSYIVNKKASGFSCARVREFKQRAILANQDMAGDQICFILAKA